MFSYCSEHLNKRVDNDWLTVLYIFLFLRRYINGVCKVERIARAVAVKISYDFFKS